MILVLTLLGAFGGAVLFHHEGSAVFGALNGWLAGMLFTMRGRLSTVEKEVRTLRHVPFTIGPIERDAWLRCMRIAVDEADLHPAHRDQLWQYLEYAAHSMVNSPV